MRIARTFAALVLGFSLQASHPGLASAHINNGQNVPTVTQNDTTVSISASRTTPGKTGTTPTRQTSDPGYVPPYPYGATPNHPNFGAWQNAIDACPENGTIETCIAQYNDMLKPTNGRATYTPPSHADVQQAARHAVLTMQIPLPTPQIAPTANEWHSAIVGHPLWLWTDGPRTVTASNHDNGIPLRLTATLDHINFAMGDGTTITCHTTTVYPPAIKPGTPSPTCGHAYQQAPRASRTYTVTATAYWSITWSGMGYTGTFTATITDTTDLPIRELQAVLVVP